tara:strand:+ start:61 stop:654 length:594 start_codon:yes stop_codon:yes gene_type:complete
MFSVPIIHYEIENWEFNKKRILDALPPECPEHADPQDHGLYTDFFLTAAEGVTEMPSYSKTVIDIIKPYLADFSGERRIEFTDMWYQKYYKGVQHSYHNHGHSGWSSVIFVEFDPKLHEATQFISPFNNIWNGNLEIFQPPVNEGDMIIFPSTIAHEAPPNRSDTRRTIVSYNLRGHTDTVKATLWEGLPFITKVAP